MDNATVQQARPPKKNAPWKRWLLILGSLLLGCLAIAAIVAGTTYYKIRKLRNEFTDSELKRISAAHMNAAAKRRLLRNYKSMRRAIAGKQTKRFEFTGEQLNQLVESLPGMEKMRNKVCFTILDHTLKVKTGLSLDQIPGFENRFINGDFTLDIQWENDKLDIHVLEATVRGKPLPPMIMDSLRKRDIADFALQNPKIRRQLQGIKSLRVQGGKLIVETGE